tara:strand:+ start:880 stop:1110 length:231 start_codon:yes stop_codon:yes gene_type:complete
MKVKFGVNKAVYKAVKSVLGKKEAQTQLNKLVEAGCVTTECKWLCGAFEWADTPQGFDYWYDIFSNHNLRGPENET